MEFLMQFLEREQVGGIVLPNGGMRAAAGLDGANAFGLERVVLRQKFAVFLRENIIRHGGDASSFAQAFAKLQHQRRLAAAHRPPDTNGECPLIEIAIVREFAVMKMARIIRVRMTISAVGMKMKEQSHKSTLEQARVKPVLRALPQIEQRRRLRDIVERE